MLCVFLLSWKMELQWEQHILISILQHKHTLNSSLQTDHETERFLEQQVLSYHMAALRSNTQFLGAYSMHNNFTYFGGTEYDLNSVRLNEFWSLVSNLAVRNGCIRLPIFQKAVVQGKHQQSCTPGISMQIQVAC